jgi:hypothetical protein
MSAELPAQVPGPTPVITATRAGLAEASGAFRAGGPAAPLQAALGQASPADLRAVFRRSSPGRRDEALAHFPEERFQAWLTDPAAAGHDARLVGWVLGAYVQHRATAFTTDNALPPVGLLVQATKSRPALAWLPWLGQQRLARLGDGWEQVVGGTPPWSERGDWVARVLAAAEGRRPGMVAAGLSAAAFAATLAAAYGAVQLRASLAGGGGG